MYDIDQKKINPPAQIVADGISFDAWLDTPEGWAWADDMADAAEMSRVAFLYGDRPALGTTWEGY